MPIRGQIGAKLWGNLLGNLLGNFCFLGYETQ
jgi:hypothetical protein